ncbi:TonB-dependent receptor plug domain-containing protein [Croceicoccus naphthovorans]|uniref:TonB-dependent receptor n=1 Tax=Croceicoccus naphthovorans TaxID=1348774 RepID=A0A0G3XH77_9SPHN|nr:TonB-dependent receptor [Croceicoccus naphthovorans]AKM09979.1 TonB-dependent receptor [Croceicoccus naphthovorans]MBB3991152.1 vitamin B12 transporter [Croceicoccus naphthovorans]
MPEYRFLTIPAIAAGLSITPAAQADTASDEIVVAALRMPVEIDRVASSVTVLDLDEIEAEQPISITDILVRTPGISMSRNGGYGAATSLRVRGADAGHSVLVIDGMRLSDASTTDGGADFGGLFADDIERIEILRGPQSVLWGSNAIGGVVNVVSARPDAPLEGRVAIEGGSRNTLSARAGAGGRSKAIDWRIAGSTFTTDGISARDTGTERDGYRRQSGSGTLTARLTPNLSLDLRGYYASGRNDFDGFSGDSRAYGLTEVWSAYSGLKAAFLDGRFNNRFAFIENRTDRDNFDPDRTVRAQTFDAQGRTRRYEYQGGLDISDAIDVAFGAEREEQRMRTASPRNTTDPVSATRAQADIDSIYAQARVTPAQGFTAEGGVRHDDHSLFGGNTVVSLGASFAPGDGGTVVRSNYSEGFKAPSLYQLFTQYGSEDLQPERAKGWEAGIEQRLANDRAFVSVTYFERKSENLIDFAYCPTTGTPPVQCFIPGTEVERFGYYANIDRSRARGVEVAGSAQFGPVFANGNVSWIDAEDRSVGASEGEQLPRVPRYLANAALGYAASAGHSLSLALRYAGKSLDRSGGIMLGDYWLTDLRAEVTLAESLSLYGRVENLFDTDYATASGYAALGRSAYLGARARF